MKRPMLEGLIEKGWKPVGDFGDCVILGKKGRVMRILYNPRSDEINKKYIVGFKPFEKPARPEGIFSIYKEFRN